MRIALFRKLPIAVALAASVAGCHRQTATPSIDDLTNALEQTAEKTLPAPSLTNEQIILPAQSGNTNAQASDVIAAATAAGGVAIRSVNAQGQLSILATIPENNAQAFKAALRHEKPPMDSPAPTTTLIEILIENPAPSPSP